jgi:hypothetical protein
VVDLIDLDLKPTHPLALIDFLSIQSPLRVHLNSQ